MKFTKMQGCGNCYIYINCFEENVTDPVELSKFVSDIRFGIGSDGLILIKPSDKADFMMDIYNLDGSRAKMCGNGIRCVGKYVYDHKLTDKTHITVDTLSGIKYLDLNVENGVCTSVRVDMNKPILDGLTIPTIFDQETVIDKEIEVNGEKVNITCVSMGNPHAIIFTDDAENAPVHTLGPVLEKSEFFPEQANIEFVQVINSKEVRMRVWERGSGETWACGTGACATAVACFLNGKTGRDVLVHMNGGDVYIEYKEDTLFMTGPAVTVCEGELNEIS